MQPLVRMIRLTVLAPAALLSLVVQAQSEKTNTPYPSMAPIDRYLIPEAGAEISLAKSAAPKSISDRAEVILLERRGRHPGNRRDVLHDVEGWPPQRSRWTLASALDVFCPTN